MYINRKICGVWVGDKHPVRIMGVLNLGPESFYKGSIVTTEAATVERAKEMVIEGAEFLDLGAMSTAPGVNNISEDEELSKLLPVLKAVLDAVDVPISVDTFRPNVANEALNIGANIINDVSGFKHDKNMVKILADHDTPSVIMATNRVIGDPLTVPEIIKSLQESLDLTKKFDYDRGKVIVDPAIGRWVPEKTYQYNLNIIKQLSELIQLDCPILVGISRKSFIHEILARPDPKERLFGSLSATAIAVINGAHIVRTHDVAATRDVVRVAELLKPNNS